MKFIRITTFAITFVLSSAALAALTPANPSLADLTGSFRLNARNLADTEAETNAVDAADATMGAEYKKYSKALAKASAAMKKLDQAFGDDADYNEQADTAVSFLNLTLGTQLGLLANFALVDDVPRSPLRYAKLIQKNTKVLEQVDLSNATSKISRAKDRAKQIKLMASAAKKFESTIKRYGKNNADF